MTEYLITLFKTLRSLEPDRPGVPDGIAYDQGSLYVLVGMGDVRVRVPVQEFDADPAKAAEVAINQWKAMTPDDQEMARRKLEASGSPESAPSTLRQPGSRPFSDLLRVLMKYLELRVSVKG